MSSIRDASALARTTLAGLILGLGACDASEPGQTPLRISAYGEGFAEDKIPAAEFVDGWEIEFSRMLVAISNVEANGTPLEGSFVVDLSRESMGEGHALGVITLPAEGHPHLSFTVAPPTEAHPVSATEQDAQQMHDEGISILAEGEATRGDQVMSFSWGFATTTRYEECHGAADLAADPQPTSELTLHADHLFYDDLDSEEPNVAFDRIASADTNADGEVTSEELRALDITTEARYQVGSREITDLWGFIEAQTVNVGHIDGEGHCERAG